MSSHRINEKQEERARNRSVRGQQQRSFISQFNSTSLTDADGHDVRQPGAVAVRGIDYQSSVSDDGDDDESYDSAVRQGGAFNNREVLYDAVCIPAEIPVTATLVSDIVVDAEIVDSSDQPSSQSKLLRYLLCVRTPKTHILDENAVFGILENFPDLFKQKYELLSSDGELVLSLYPLCLVCRLNPSVELVKRVHQAYPPAISTPDEDGRLPIHSACACDANIGVIQYLLRANNESALAPSKHGYLPIHLSCLCATKPNVIFYLISRYPECLEYQSEDGSVPLHTALRADAHGDSVLLRLISLYPKAATIATNSGWLPIHIACRSNNHELYASTDVVKALLQLYPETAQSALPEPDGRLPLHIACGSINVPRSLVYELLEIFPEGVRKMSAYGYPLNYAAQLHSDKVILKLLRAFPDAARQMEGSWRYPLQAALTKRRSEALVTELLSAHPEAAKVGEPSNGRFPLHQLLSKTEPYSFDIVDRVISLHPDAVKVAVFGSYPLHLACQNRSTVEVVRLLLNHFPEAAQTPGPNLRLPLHLVCAANSMREEVVQLLISSNPGAARLSDKRGLLPLHLAVRSSAPPAVVELLLATYPEGARITAHGSLLALHIACSSNAPESVVRLLVDANTDGITTRNRRGDTPLDLAMSSRSSPGVIDLLKNYTTAS